ncbi:uncharacterized protein PHACADRAFT_264255 [Phanerochaete carnosa HHB-10118-sp]|uniref:Uncharacterized protein n=1 Tax=Phanerochaete carnosa (strain HHB-10118-sp) TaxID=650164 RepID=K5VW16_PHACS|nr:uncharacterized protein PHACADRAFT_264255 [Phanerochaete carnosa HHB-10118-sp]EKM50774.1 hypothetical protein PHACADRAFT_264255 [Phanerochaete carnosa HHB-10118-sp]
MTEELERSPSRMGFTRPLMCKSSDFGLESASGEDDDEKWEFAGALLVPSSSTSSEGSDSFDDFEPSDASTPGHKPALPSRTISLSNIPMQLPVVHEPAEVDSYYHVATPIATSASYTLLTPADHGLSRSALSHLKGFWSARQGEYAKLEAQLALAEASPYGGILELPRSRDGLRAALVSRLSRPGLRLAHSARAPPTSSPNVNAPIYPRTGDLTTLRDARSAVLDRAFCNLTLNSINKILFLHDMLQRANHSPTANSLSASDEALSTDDSSSFVDISLNTISSENSCESTFVADEQTSCQQYGCDGTDCGGKHETASCDRSWEIDWVARWKVLLARVKEDPLLPSTSPLPSPVDEKAFWAAFSPPKPAKFFIPEEEDEFFGCDSDGEDDDYGVMVTQPAYGVTADSLSREFLHNLCEYRLSMEM